MFKQFTLLLLATILLWTPLQLSAQSTSTEIESLGIEFWPDYDDTAVLVLLTGYLPAETSYPVTLTIPLPEDANVNAVAHITAENYMSDQGIEYEIAGDELTFTSPSPGFRIEFYIPYTADDLNRDFSYTWQSNDTAVNDLRILIQEPISAAKLSTIPNSTTAAPGEDGLTYHTLPTQSVSIGEPFTVDVSYSMNSPALTASLLTNTAVTDQSPPVTSTPIENSTAINWPLLLGGLGLMLILIAGGWQLATKRTSNKPIKPKKKHPAPTQKTKFCHECGTKLNNKDKYCRDCGTAVK